MVRQNLCLYHVALLLLCCLFQTEARPVSKTTHIPILSRQGIPPICEPASLELAVDCGCFLYFPLYSPDLEWQFLEDVCLQELSGNIESGESSCSASPYGHGYRNSIQGRELSEIEDRASLFFSEADQQCSSFDPTTGLPNSTTGLTAPGPITAATPSSGPSISFASRTGPRLSSDHTSSFAVSSRFDVHFGLPGENILDESKASLETAIVVRNIGDSGKRKLGHFCRTLMYHKKFPRAERNRLCN